MSFAIYKFDKSVFYAVCTFKRSGLVFGKGEKNQFKKRPVSKVVVICLRWDRHL